MGTLGGGESDLWFPASPVAEQGAQGGAGGWRELSEGEREERPREGEREEEGLWEGEGELEGSWEGEGELEG